MFGISGGEFIVIVLIAAFVLGPKNVAQAVVGFRKIVEKARTWSARVRQETTVDLGSLGFDTSDVEKLRNLKLADYDPRQMVRQAVQEEMAEWMKATSGAGATGKADMAAAAAAFEAGVKAGQNSAAGPGQEESSSQVTNNQPNYLAASPTNEVQSEEPLDLHTILNRPDLGGSR
ncbi:hypothetical protein [Ancrocorticia populi]|uniref:hypothetical protein n=1 Tax=Ancrocorticia populi TaxID=2175228 RepID=UPI0023525243|nr:hypothetical protein [Ancrocorticia populi]